LSSAHGIKIHKSHQEKLAFVVFATIEGNNNDNNFMHKIWKWLRVLAANLIAQ